MRHFSFYDPATGDFTGDHFSSDDELAVSLNTTGRPAIEGRHSHLTHRVDLATKTVVPRDTPRPQTRLERRHEALAKIHALEARQSRVIREFLLGDAGAKEGLQAIDDEIAKLRAELK